MNILTYLASLILGAIVWLSLYKLGASNEACFFFSAPVYFAVARHAIIQGCAVNTGTQHV